MDINLQDFDIDSDIYKICRELQKSVETNYILHCYKYDYSNMLSYGEVPFLLKGGKIIWNVDIKTVTIGDIINTFYSSDDVDYILNVESDFCKAGDIDFEIKTSKKEFFIQWGNLVKNWGGLNLKSIDRHRFREFINQKIVSPMSVIQAVYLREDYLVGEFASEFSCTERQAASVMKCLGYKNINNERNYSINTEFKQEVDIICDDVNGILHFYRDNKYISPIKWSLRDIYKNLALFFERKRDNISLEIDLTAERIEPARGERFDWPGFLGHMSLLICIIIFIISICIIFQQINTTEESQYDSLITLIVAVLSAVAALFIERWTVTQNYKIDYHNERLKVMPIFSVKCYEQDELNRYKTEYKTLNQKDPIVENQNGHKMPMFAVYENIGEGIAFQTYIYSCSANPEPVKGHTMAVKDSIIVEFEKGCYNDMYISYRDLYGNLYQQYIKIDIDIIDDKIEVIEQPPELIMRTRRARYIQ